MAKAKPTPRRSKIITEPPRRSSISELAPYVARRVKLILDRMIAAGYDPVVHEAFRTKTRQEWLYAKGRTTSGPIVTHTMNSKHLVGKAVDIISRNRGWRWPEFFNQLHFYAQQFGMYSIPGDACHLEWRG